MAISAFEDRYQQERQKRQDASKGQAQYLGRHECPAFTRGDPWVKSGTPVKRPVEDGGHVKIIIFGAGFAGLLIAIKCLETGTAKTPEDILIVDPAGGYGGTWYWNRYPGLMCDVESYVYLPLLEETGYMPKRRYSSGHEIRQYCELLARHFKIHDRAQFQTYGKALTWETNHWKCELLEKPKGLPEEKITIKADYVVLGSGNFTLPKVPKVPGMHDFEGHQLHTGRWNYDITGGSFDNPVLDRLRDKKVAIIGTGATAIQAVPEVAKYAQKLYVVQRTPSAVDFRGNRDTDPEEFRTKIATKKGWQKERDRNLQIFTEQSHDLPENMTNDGFSTMPTIAMGWGGPSDITAENVSQHVDKLRSQDDVRSEKVRARVDEIVKNVEVGKKLQAWYPGWCKRPTFHDDYLPAFNQPNVELVDTDGLSVEKITKNSFFVNGQEYPVDIIIWSTGYGNPLSESLAGKAEITVKGRTGQDMEDLNKALQLATLHGTMSYGFPNIFFTGLSQSGVGVNQIQRLQRQSEHVAYIISSAEKRLGSGQKPILEPTEEACQAWGDEIAKSAHLIGAMLVCTPGYFTAEGDAPQLPPETLAKLARTGIYGQGLLKYMRILDEWEAEGNLQGMSIDSVRVDR